MGTTTKPAPAGPDPFSDLALLEKELAKLEQQASQIQADAQTKKSQVQKLKSFLGDTDKVVQAYAAVLPKLTAEFQIIGEVAAQHRKEVEAVLTKEKVDAIGKIIETADANLKKALEEAGKAAGDAAAAQKAADDAAAAVKQAEAALADVKQTQSVLEKQLKQLRELREQEAKADAADTPASDRHKAVFVIEIENALNGPAPMTPDQLRTALIAGLNAIEDAKKKYETAKTDAAAAMKAAEEAKKKYEAAVAGRTAAILETAAGA